MENIKNCPNCKTKINSGVFTIAKLMTPKEVKIINLNKDVKHDAYCSKCGEYLLRNAKDKILKLREDIAYKISTKAISIPVLTTHYPYNWDYTSLGLVTGQSTTGTGVVTEFTSGFTDFFGAQSKRHNTKVKKGEDLCLAQIKSQALDYGANAIIAVDIDYSEIGSSKGMILVCMSGTAVKVNNGNEVFGDKTLVDINDINDLQKEDKILADLLK